MICKIVNKLLPSYTSNELASLPAIIVEQHIRRCPECAKEAETYFRMCDWIGSARETVTPECLVSWETVEMSYVKPKKRAYQPYSFSWAYAPILAGFMVFLLFRVTQTPIEVTEIKPPVSSSVTKANVIPEIKISQTQNNVSKEISKKKSTARANRSSKNNNVERPPIKVTVSTFTTLSLNNSSDSNTEPKREKYPSGKPVNSPTVTAVQPSEDNHSSSTQEVESDKILWDY